MVSNDMYINNSHCSLLAIHETLAEISSNEVKDRLGYSDGLALPIKTCKQNISDALVSTRTNVQFPMGMMKRGGVDKGRKFLMRARQPYDRELPFSTRGFSEDEANDNVN